MPKRKATRGRGRGRGAKSSVNQKSKNEDSIVDLSKSVNENDDNTKEEREIVEDSSTTDQMEEKFEDVDEAKSDEKEKVQKPMAETEVLKDDEKTCKEVIDTETSVQTAEKVDGVSSKPKEEKSSVSTPVGDNDDKVESKLDISDPLITNTEADITDKSIEKVENNEEMEKEGGKVENIDNALSDKVDDEERVEEAEEEVYLDKEVDDDVQYIDEEIEEIDEEGEQVGEQDLLDVMEMGDNKNKRKQKKERGINKDDLKSKQDDNDDVGDNTFEEISEGSMEPMEQEEIIDAISDNEIIIESPSQDAEEENEKEKPSRKRDRSPSLHEEDRDETIAELFDFAANDDHAVEVQDNDDISDASLCDDDDKNNLSLEEISEDEFESSKRRKLDVSISNKSVTSTVDDQNKDKTVNEDKETEPDTKKDASETGESADAKDPKKRLNDDEEDSITAKRQKLSESGDNADQSNDASENYEKTTSTTETDTEKDKTKQASIPPQPSTENVKAKSGQNQVKSDQNQEKSDPNQAKSGQNPVKTPSSKSTSSSCVQTHPIDRKGKIIQCSISRIGSETAVIGLKKDPYVKMKEEVSNTFDKYKSHLPSSVENMFTEVASTQLPEEGFYSLSLGPVTVADFGNDQFRDICLSSAEKFNLTFNSKMQGLLQAQFSKHKEVNRMIHNLKGLDLGIRYMILSLVYRTKQGKNSEDNGSELWQAILIFTYNQDDSHMVTWGDTNDGKVRSRLSIDGVPNRISKDFVQLLFPEALYISTALGKENGRTLTLGFSSTRITKETFSCYELLLLNGDKVEITSMDPVLSETKEEDPVSGFIEEDGTVIVQDIDETDEAPSISEDKEKEIELNKDLAADITEKADIEGEKRDSADEACDNEREKKKNDESSLGKTVDESDKERKEDEEGDQQDLDGGSKKETSTTDPESSAKVVEFGESNEKKEQSSEEEKTKETQVDERDKVINEDKIGAQQIQQDLDSVSKNEIENIDVESSKKANEKVGESNKSKESSEQEKTEEVEKEQLVLDKGTEGQECLHEQVEDDSIETVGAQNEADKEENKTRVSNVTDGVEDISVNNRDAEDKDKEESMEIGEGEHKKVEENDGDKTSRTEECNQEIGNSSNKDSQSEVGEKNSTEVVNTENSEVCAQSAKADKIARSEAVGEKGAETDSTENNEKVENETTAESGVDGVSDKENLEDVSDDEMISTEATAKATEPEDDDDDDVIILNEEPFKKIIANIDLTAEDPDKPDNDNENKGSEENKDSKKIIKKEFEVEDLIDVDKLTMTDGDFEVTLESIEVEDDELEYESILSGLCGGYRGKYYNNAFKRTLQINCYNNHELAWRNYQNNLAKYEQQQQLQQNKYPIRRTGPFIPQRGGMNQRGPPPHHVNMPWGPPPRLPPPRPPAPPEFNFQRIYGRPENEVRGDPSPGRHAPAREETALRKEVPRRGYDIRKSRSPSPRRDATSDQPSNSSSYKQHSSSYNKPYRDNRQADSQPQRPSSSSYYDYKKDSRSLDEYNNRSSNRSRQSSSKYDNSSVNSRDEYRSSHQQQRSVVPQPAATSTRHEDKSRSFSPLSSSSVSSSEVLLRQSPLPPQRSRRVSHSPISDSLSPISKSPSPPPPSRHYSGNVKSANKYQDPSPKSRSPQSRHYSANVKSVNKYRASTPPKAYRDKYSPISVKDFDTERMSSGQRDQRISLGQRDQRISSGQRKSPSPQHYQSWEREREREKVMRDREVERERERLVRDREIEREMERVVRDRDIERERERDREMERERERDREMERERDRRRSRSPQYRRRPAAATSPVPDSRMRIHDKKATVSAFRTAQVEPRNESSSRTAIDSSSRNRSSTQTHRKQIESAFDNLNSVYKKLVAAGAGSSAAAASSSSSSKKPAAATSSSVAKSSSSQQQGKYKHGNTSSSSGGTPRTQSSTTYGQMSTSGVHYSGAHPSSSNITGNTSQQNYPVATGSYPQGPPPPQQHPGMFYPTNPAAMYNQPNMGGGMNPAAFQAAAYGQQQQAAMNPAMMYSYMQQQPPSAGSMPQPSSNNMYAAAAYYNAQQQQQATMNAGSGSGGMPSAMSGGSASSSSKPSGGDGKKNWSMGGGNALMFQRILSSKK